jgi:transketolase C-terminal domain/subunit
MDQKPCWNCKFILNTNEYGFAVCSKCDKVTFGDRKNYIIATERDPAYLYLQRQPKHQSYHQSYYYRITKPQRLRERNK